MSALSTASTGTISTLRVRFSVMSALSMLVHRFFVRLVRNYISKYPSTSVSAKSLFVFVFFVFFLGGGGTYYASTAVSFPIVGRLGGFVYRLFVRLVRDHWQLTEGIKRLEGS